MSSSTEGVRVGMPPACAMSCPCGPSFPRQRDLTASSSPHSDIWPYLPNGYIRLQCPSGNSIRTVRLGIVTSAVTTYVGVTDGGGLRTGELDRRSSAQLMPPRSHRRQIWQQEGETE